MSLENSGTGLLLDKHIWVRYINGTPGLKPAIVTAVEAPPSDRIIVASARVEGLRLVTLDKDTIRFGKQHRLQLELA